MRRLPAVAVLCSFILYTGSAAATSMRKLSLGELAQNSKSIVVAKVTKSESRWDGREIYTYTSLSVLKGLKGARKGDAIVVRQLGGQVGNIASIVPGMPSFADGEEVLVFLTRNDKAGFPWVNGLQQGKFSINTVKGRKSVVGNTSELNLIGKGNADGAVDFDMFISDVEAALGLPTQALPSENTN